MMKTFYRTPPHPLTISFKQSRTVIRALALYVVGGTLNIVVNYYFTNNITTF